MAKDQVKIEIQGKPPKWLSYEVEGNTNDLVNALYSAMRDKHELYEIMQEACNAYEWHLVESKANN